MLTNSSPNSIFKIDRFVVPAAARADFLERVRWIRDFLAGRDGCRQSLLLEAPGDEGDAILMTIAEWRDAAAFAAARSAAAEHYREASFDPAAFLTSRGIAADMANYRVLG